MKERTDLKEGYYLLSNGNDEEKCLVYLYTNPDTGIKGLGFNLRDGGGFLPLDDLIETSILNEIAITQIQKIKS